MQSVVLFNSSAFSVSRLSFADSTRRKPPPEEVVRVKLEVDSISNLDSGLGLSSLSALVPLLSAQVCVVAERWTDAISLYESTLPVAIAQGQDRWLAKFHAELASCYASVGRTDDARSAIAQSLETMEDCSDIDDRAIAHARLSTALKSIGLRERSLEHEAAMQTHRSSFERLQRKLREELRPLLQQLPS
jgi:tetratricopeptide (TPR) repeat protein